MTMFYSRWHELIQILVVRNLKIRYKGSALGFFWSLLTPGLTILMYAVFAKILKFNGGQAHYLQFLVTGILVWQFTAGTLSDSLAAISGSSNLVKKVYFPRIILPVTTVFANGVNFLLTIVPLLLYLALTHTLVLTHALWLIPAVLFQLFLCVGIACFVATLNVYFRDMQHLFSILTLGWMYATPIFYPLEQLPPFAQGVMKLNPMYHYINMFRNLVMYGNIPGPNTWFACAASGAVMLALGLWVFHKLQRNFILYI